MQEGKTPLEMHLFLSVHWSFSKESKKTHNIFLQWGQKGPPRAKKTQRVPAAPPLRVHLLVALLALCSIQGKLFNLYEQIVIEMLELKEVDMAKSLLRCVFPSV
jgi:hypothetical protein